MPIDPAPTPPACPRCGGRLLRDNDELWCVAHGMQITPFRATDESDPYRGHSPGPTRCRVCGTAFLPEPMKRGVARRYCPRHRAARYRQRRG